MTTSNTETPARFVVKEGADDKSFIAIEPGIINLYFHKPTSLDEAGRTAKWLNHYFRVTVGTGKSRQPPNKPAMI